MTPHAEPMTHPRAERVRAVAALAGRSARRRTDTFLVEGPQGVREAVRFAPERIVDLYVTAEAEQRYGEFVEPAREAGVFVHEVTDEVLARLREAATTLLSNPVIEDVVNVAVLDESEASA